MIVGLSAKLPNISAKFRFYRRTAVLYRRCADKFKYLKLQRNSFSKNESVKVYFLALFVPSKGSSNLANNRFTV